MYKFYLKDLLLPVTPSKLELKIKNKNSTLDLINEGEINIPKNAGLTEISFEIDLPNNKYPHAIYENGFKEASYYLEEIEKLKVNKQPFQFIVTRTRPNDNKLFDTNIKVLLEDYTIKEDTSNGIDVKVNIKLKQYRDYATKTMEITIKQERTVAQVTETRAVDNSSDNNATYYTVVKGDCLWKIAKKFYGDGNRWTEIYNANTDKIKNPNLIYPGQVLFIPNASSSSSSSSTTKKTSSAKTTTKTSTSSTTTTIKQGVEKQTRTNIQEITDKIQAQRDYAKSLMRTSGRWWKMTDNYELLIQNGNTVYAPVVQNDITWETERKGTPRKISI